MGWIINESCRHATTNQLSSIAIVFTGPGFFVNWLECDKCVYAVPSTVQYTTTHLKTPITNWYICFAYITMETTNQLRFNTRCQDHLIRGSNWLFAFIPKLFNLMRPTWNQLEYFRLVLHKLTAWNSGGPSLNNNADTMLTNLLKWSSLTYRWNTVFLF